jgi:hypothetical protein
MNKFPHYKSIVLGKKNASWLRSAWLGSVPPLLQAPESIWDCIGDDVKRILTSSISIVVCLAAWIFARVCLLVGGLLGFVSSKDDAKKP